MHLIVPILTLSLAIIAGKSLTELACIAIICRVESKPLTWKDLIEENTIWHGVIPMASSAGLMAMCTFTKPDIELIAAWTYIVVGTLAAGGQWYQWHINQRARERENWRYEFPGYFGRLYDFDSPRPRAG